MTGFYGDQYPKQLISKLHRFEGEGAISFAGRVAYCYHHVDPCQ